MRNNLKSCCKIMVEFWIKMIELGDGMEHHHVKLKLKRI